MRLRKLWQTIDGWPALRRQAANLLAHAARVRLDELREKYDPEQVTGTSRGLASLASGCADRIWLKRLAERGCPAVLILDDFRGALRHVPDAGQRNFGSGLIVG